MSMHSPGGRSTPALGSVLVAIALFSLALTASTDAAADIYSDAVAHPGRSPADIERDAIEHPAEVLRLAGFKPGMKVADFLAADGYWSELLSYIVGPQGHVLLINNAAFAQWSEHGWEKRLANGRLPNVEYRAAETEHLGIPDASLDGVLVIKVYHDLYWVADKGPWPKMDPNVVLTGIARALKPGGILLLIDHSAKPGTGSADAGTLHRIDEKYALKDWEKHGFKLVAETDLLRRPDDPRAQISYKGPMLGKTDRFVMVFHKKP